MRTLLKRVFSTKLTPELKSFLETLLGQHKVVLFMKGTPEAPQCGFSNYVVEALKFYNVPSYQHVNVLEDAEVREAVKEFSEWPTIPQLYVNAKFVGGCDILAELHNKGQLEGLLREEGVV